MEDNNRFRSGCLGLLGDLDLGTPIRKMLTSSISISIVPSHQIRLLWLLVILPRHMVSTMDTFSSIV